MGCPWGRGVCRVPMGCLRGWGAYGVRVSHRAGVPMGCLWGRGAHGVGMPMDRGPPRVSTGQRCLQGAHGIVYRAGVFLG